MLGHVTIQDIKNVQNKIGTQYFNITDIIVVDVVLYCHVLKELHVSFVFQPSFETIFMYIILGVCICTYQVGFPCQ